jgi:hypothetical protein
MTNLVDEYFAVLEKVGVDDFWHPELEALRQRITRTCPTISVGGAPSKPGRRARAANLDQKRHRKRTIPTANAIRATKIFPKIGRRP